MKYRIPIEVKSFFFNIKNDNEKGHTATVASILKQGGSLHEDVAQVKYIPENICKSSRDGLVNTILESSRAEAQINRLCCFDKISVNGVPVEIDSFFCIYVREETSPANVHCGRQKLHYPPSLVYSDDNIEINNKRVAKKISEVLGNYAFIVEAFIYDTDTGYLDIDATIVGSNDIPYSKVFVNKKGAGSKFTLEFCEETDDYDTEIIALRQQLGYDNVGPSNFKEIMDNQKNVAYEIVAKSLEDRGATNIRYLSLEYPYAIYDIEYRMAGVKHYGIVRHSATMLKQFVLSMEKVSFISCFSDYASVFLVSDILRGKKIYEYSSENVKEMRKRIRSLNLDASEI